MPRAVTALAAMAVGLGACGADDKTADNDSTATRPQSTTTQPDRSGRTTSREPAPPKVPAAAARDVARVRSALEAAGYTVKQSRFPGQPLAQLEVGSTLVAFYASADDAARNAAALKKAFDGRAGQGSVRVSDKRLYTASKAGGLTDADRAAFSKIVSTSEAAT